MYRVRRVLCVEVKQRQILPGLSEADYPQTGSRAHEKKAYSCYAVGRKKPLIAGLFGHKNKEVKD